MGAFSVIAVICILYFSPNYSAFEHVGIDYIEADAVNFDCKLLTSPEPPCSVHQLMPGDIKVIGALGDSLTAGNGAKAETLPGIAIQYRGVVAAAGGDEDLNTVTTLPNIFRRYNEKLYGYSSGRGKYTDPNSKFNVAIPGVKSPGMENQAIDVVSRIKGDANIDFENDWKLITIFIGGNDLCQWCNDEVNLSPGNYVANIEKAIRVLQQMPKTFVNVIGILNVYQISSLTGGVCDIIHHVVCGCGMGDDAKIEQLKQITKKYQSLLEESIISGQFDNREDFTVVYQPFFHNTDMPQLPDGSADLSYFAPDCFHFSEKGNQAGSIALWNNMIQPVGDKSTSWDEIHKEIQCPTKESPYLFTNKNSNRQTVQESGNYVLQIQNMEYTIKIIPFANDNTGNENQKPSPTYAVILGVVAGVVVLLLVAVVAAIAYSRKRKAATKETDLLLPK